MAAARAKAPTMRALVLALALLAVLLAAAAPRGASASAARLARVSARVSAAEAALAEALADAAEAGGAPADAAPADAAAAPEAGTSATMGAGLQLDGDSVAGPDAPVQVGPDTRRIRPGANMPSAIRRRRPRVPDRVFTANAPPATVTGQFGRGKLTVIRNENDFVTKVRQSDDTKAQEAAVKVQAVTEQSTKTAERMDRYTAERRVQARLALAKEKLEAEAEAAEKKVQQEKQQMQEAKLKEQLAAREKAAREEAEKHDAIATTQIRLRAEDSFCLGAQRSVRAAGTPLVLELCDPSVSGQLWKLHPDQTVRLAVDRKWCLALPSAASGQRPVLAPCETDKSQMWRRMSDATLRLVAAPALAVTAKDGVARPGQHAEMREVQPFDASAEFDLAAPGAPGASPLPRVVALRDQFMRDWCAAPERSALDPSARAVVAKTVFSQAQLWLVHPTDFTVRAAGRPSLCLQVRGGRPDQGAPLELGSCSSRPEDFQRWTLDRDGFLRMRDYPQWVAEIAGSGQGMPDQGFQLQVGAVAAARTKWQQWTLLEAPANNQIFGTF